MFNDMDFLSQVTPLVDALGVNPSTMRRNPFALPHNLDQSTPPSKAKGRKTRDGEKGDERGDAEDKKEEDEERDDDAKRFREAEWTIVQEKKRVLKSGTASKTGQKAGIIAGEPWIMSPEMMITTGGGEGGSGGRAHTLEPLPYASTPNLYSRAVSQTGLRHLRGEMEHPWLSAAKHQMKLLSEDLDKAAWPYNSGTGRGKAKKGWLLEYLQGPFCLAHHMFSLSESLMSCTVVETTMKALAPLRSSSAMPAESSPARNFARESYEISERVYEEVLPKQYIFNRSMELPGKKKKKRKRRTRRIEFGFSLEPRRGNNALPSVGEENYHADWPELGLLNIRNLKKLSKMQRPRTF